MDRIVEMHVAGASEFEVDGLSMVEDDHTVEVCRRPGRSSRLWVVQQQNFAPWFSSASGIPWNNVFLDSRKYIGYSTALPSA